MNVKSLGYMRPLRHLRGRGVADDAAAAAIVPQQAVAMPVASTLLSAIPVSSSQIRK